MKSCGCNKAPGPDGFNFKFIREAWSFLKEDVFQFLSEFERNAVAGLEMIKVLGSLCFMQGLNKKEDTLLADFDSESVKNANKSSWIMVHKHLYNQLVDLIDGFKS